MAKLVNYVVLKHNNIRYIFSAMDSVTFIPQGHLKATSPCNKTQLLLHMMHCCGLLLHFKTDKYVSPFHLPLLIACRFCLLLIVPSPSLLSYTERINVELKIWWYLSVVCFSLLIEPWDFLKTLSLSTQLYCIYLLLLRTAVNYIFLY